MVNWPSTGRNENRTNLIPACANELSLYLDVSGMFAISTITIVYNYVHHKVNRTNYYTLLMQYRL